MGSEPMEHDRKNFGVGKWIGTFVLILVLLLVIFSEIVIYISGPAIHYEEKIAAQEEVILKEYEGIKRLSRHVFAYIIYSGQDDNTYYWFNEQGALLTWRSLADLDMETARKTAVDAYGMKEETLRLGYGYENPVYIIEDVQTEVYLDIDTMKQVFIRKKGL